MHPNEERPHGYWEVDDPPDPTVAQTSEEFAAELNVLVRWSQLPISEIELRARAYGSYVPDGAVAEALRGSSLPTEQLLVEILWAVGCDEETVGLWIWARNNLAGAHAHFDPTEVFWVPGEPPRHTESALAGAVQERGDQGGWRGLHRHGVPDDGDTKYAPKRLRVKESSPSTGWGMIVLVVAGVIALVAGGVVVLTSGGSEVASPPGPACCLDSSDAGSQTPEATQATDAPTTTPEPGTSTKPVVTPRPSATTRGPSPTTSQTQGQPPQLNGTSTDAECSGGSGAWIVTFTVNATLAQAPSGTNPEGRAGLIGDMNPFTVNATSSTSFTGPVGINVGSDTTVAASGNILWTVTVTVPGGGTVSDEGSESFSCTPVTE